MLILTFDTKRVPEEVSAAFLRYPVRVVVPLPRRCTRCQKYGHKAGSCRAPAEICAMCGGGGHTEPYCEAATASCPSCGGPHAASEPFCPTWLREKRVQALISEGWAPGDARRRAEEERGEPPQDLQPPAQTPRPRLGPGSLMDLRRFPPLMPQQQQGAAPARPPPASQSAPRTAARPQPTIPPPTPSAHGPQPPAPTPRPANPGGPYHRQQPAPSTGAATPSPPPLRRPEPSAAPTVTHRP